MLPKGGVLVKGQVTARKRDWDGNPIGCANDNPILDTRSYIVKFLMMVTRLNSLSFQLVVTSCPKEEGPHYFSCKEAEPPLFETDA